MEHVWFFAAVLASAAFFALLEIQIEGGAGWAAKLPTWRLENRWTRLFFSRRPLTGYHLYVHLWVLTTVHLPFLLGLSPFSWTAEARVVAYLIFFWVLEDFLWFVLNREFGLRRFKAQHIWWHAPTWWWIAPRDYWIFTPLGVLLYWASHRP